MPEVRSDTIIDSWTYYISFADIAKLDICKGGSCSTLTNKELKQTLWDNGMDILKEYQIVEDTHRCLDGKVATTSRVLGTMRVDQEWKNKFGTDIHSVLSDLNTNKKYLGNDVVYTKSFNSETNDDEEE